MQTRNDHSEFFAVNTAKTLATEGAEGFGVIATNAIRAFLANPSANMQGFAGFAFGIKDAISASSGTTEEILKSFNKKFTETMRWNLGLEIKKGVMVPAQFLKKTGNYMHVVEGVEIATLESVRNAFSMQDCVPNPDMESIVVTDNILDNPPQTPVKYTKRDAMAQRLAVMMCKDTFDAESAREMLEKVNGATSESSVKTLEGLADRFAEKVNTEMTGTNDA